MKKFRDMRELSIFFALCLLLASCANETKLILIGQEEKIDKYLSSSFKDSTVIRNNGAYKVVIEEDLSQPILEYGDSLVFYYAGYIFDSRPSTLFDTNVEAVAKESSFALTDPNYSPKRVLFQKGELILGLEYGLANSKQGDHCVILFSGKYGFGAQKHYNIPRLSALAYEVWIDKVIKNN